VLGECPRNAATGEKNVQDYKRGRASDAQNRKRVVTSCVSKCRKCGIGREAYGNDGGKTNCAPVWMLEILHKKIVYAVGGDFVMTFFGFINSTVTTAVITIANPNNCQPLSVSARIK